MIIVMFARALVSLVLAALLSPALLAQSSDLSVTIHGPAEQASADVRYVIWANWTGDTPPADVVLEATIPGTIVRLDAGSGVTCTQDGIVRCTVPPQTVAEGGVNVVGLFVKFAAPGTYEASARITSTTPDPQLQNNQTRLVTTLSARPSLVTSAFDYFDQDGAVDPGRPARARISVQNYGDTATDVILRGTLPEGGVFVKAEKAQGEQDPVCTVSASVVECHIAQLHIQQHVVVKVDYIAPDHDRGGTFPLVSTVSSAEPEHDPADNTGRLDVPLRRLFTVTTDADAGPGSLRQHILDSRVQCADVPCLIRIPAGAPAIQPRTPLPQLWGRMKVEGGVLDGTLVHRGAALQFEGCELRVDGITIVNFRGHAIEAQGPTDPATFQRCGHGNVLTPVWVTNSKLLYNERGIVTKAISATITDNEIRAHDRAGIFVEGGYYTEIARNQITGNGASGIFIDARLPAIPLLPPGADIVDNVIRGNGHWGIARTANGSVQISGNSISGNLLYGIDVGLDLDSHHPETPVLTSATYDAANNLTVIRGTARAGGLHFYASSSLSGWGYPEAERPLTTKFISGEFEVVTEGDLRGQWITATSTRTTGVVFLRDDRKVTANARYRYQSNDTSELSLPVRVE
jgi:hypothetical protein